jgi:nucleotide-binding universal stress UspA family protein
VYSKLLIPVVEPSEVEPLIRLGAMLLDADGEIRVLHVISGGSLPEVTREWRASVNIVVPAHEAGAALDVRVDPEVRGASDVTSEILDTVETHQTDGILMTIRGSRRSRNPFVGHVASGVLHHAACDVMIVNRLALAGERASRILIPTFTENPPVKAVRIADEIAVRNQGVPIITLSLASRTSTTEDDTAPARSPRGLPMTTRRSFFSESILGRSSRLPELVLRQAAQERYGLLIVGEEGPRPVRPVLTRRFLEELFRNAPCPVLAIRG